MKPKTRNSSFFDIEKATERLVALRASAGNFVEAAARLEIADKTLSQWRDRRQLPSYL